MLKYCILAAMLSISFPGYSKSRLSSHIRVEGFAVKTDALSLLNSAINKGSKIFNLSGELYFNNQYSFIADLGAETETNPKWIRTTRRYGSQFRWYFMQDDCNCSAFFAGSYLSFVNIRQSYDHNFHYNNADGYPKSYLEGGISGGYQAIIAMHFVIDPAVQIGMEFPHDIHNSESMIYAANDNDLNLLFRISLGIGYRF
jgi:hypothetical protein